MSKRFEDQPTHEQQPARLPGRAFGRAGWWLVFWALWGLQTLVVANGRYLGMKLWGETVSWTDAFKSSLLNYGAWALISIVAFMLVRHFPFGRPHLVRNLLVHLAAAIVLVLARVAISAVVAPHVDWLTDISLRDRLVYEAPSFALYYLLLLGAASAIIYYRQARDAELLASRLEAQLANAELLLLRSQLNPHFLFNTLHSIAALMHRDVDEADRMIARLGDLLRAALMGGQVQMVPLEEELDFARAYLEIEQVRYGNQLAISWDVDPAAHGALVPSFILQPVLENAIKHGLAPRRTGGLLEITAAIEDRNLRLQVRDDGVGLRARAETRGTGIGLANTRARLEKLYGDTHRLTLSSPSGGGTVVTLSVPLRLTAADRAGDQRVSIGAP